MTNQTAEFPCSISRNGKIFYQTGKFGTNIATGKQVAEMESDDYGRVWVALDGQVFGD